MQSDAEPFVLDALRTNAQKASGLLRERGWVPSKSLQKAGELTLAGALKEASAWGVEVYLNREILTDRRTADAWQKEPDRTASEVTNMLDQFVPTTDEIVHVLGPRWQAMMMIMGSASLLSAEITTEMDSLRADATWLRACAQARETAADRGVRFSIADAFFGSDDVWCAARGAAWATALADTIGQLDSSLTYEGYAVLMEPYRRRAVPEINRLLTSGAGASLRPIVLDLFGSAAREVGIDGWSGRG